MWLSLVFLTMNSDLLECDWSVIVFPLSGSEEYGFSILISGYLD